MNLNELEARARALGITVTALGYVKTADAARVLGVSPRTLEGWRLAGEGPPYKKLNRAVWYKLTDLATWFDP